MKDEKKWLLIVAGIFSFLLVFAWIYGGGLLPLMFKYDWGFAVLTILFTITCLGAWYFAMKFFEDPNYDWLRMIIVLAAIFASVILIGYRSQHNADVKDNIAPTAYIK